MEFDIRFQQPTVIACVGHEGFFAGISSAFARLFDSLGAPGLSNASKLLTVFHYDPLAGGATQRAEAAVELSEMPGQSHGGFEVRRLPGGAYAVMCHVGPYSGLPAAWVGFAASVRRSGLQPLQGPRFEVYLNDPEEIPEEALLTELHMPVDARGLEPSGEARSS